MSGIDIGFSIDLLALHAKASTTIVGNGGYNIKYRSPFTHLLRSPNRFWSEISKNYPCAKPW